METTEERKKERNETERPWRTKWRRGRWASTERNFHRELDFFVVVVAAALTIPIGGLLTAVSRRNVAEIRDISYQLTRPLSAEPKRIALRPARAI